MAFETRIEKPHGVDPGKGNALGWQKKAVASGDYVMDVSGVSAVNHGGVDQITDLGTVADGTQMFTEVRGGSITEGTIAGETALHLQTDGNQGRLRLDDAFDAAHQVKLGDLDHLSFDYFVASSDRTDVIPVIRLTIDADGNLATTNDRVDLVFEWSYQGLGPAHTGSWQTADLIGGNWVAWEHTYSPSHNYDNISDMTTLSDWADANGFTPVGGIHVDQNSVVLGWQIAVGSFNGTNDMYIDHLHVAGQTIQFA